MVVLILQSIAVRKVLGTVASLLKLMFCNVFFFPVGHGHSDGERVQVSHFDFYLRDVFQHIDKVTADNAGIPIFMFGHSMVSCSAIEKPHQGGVQKNCIVLHIHVFKPQGWDRG